MPAIDKVFNYLCKQKALLITCNRDDLLKLAPGEHAGLIVLMRRRSRQAECAHLLTLLQRAGEDGIRGNINFV
jgi:hypothetical protein